MSITKKEIKVTPFGGRNNNPLLVIDIFHNKVDVMPQEEAKFDIVVNDKVIHEFEVVS